MICKSDAIGEYRKVSFILVPRDDRLPIRRMSVSDCISSCDPQFSYGYTPWYHGGKSENPFYWANEDWRYDYNGKKHLQGLDVWIEDGEEVPSGHNPYIHYNQILTEWHENWKEICQELLNHHDESITLVYQYFKVVSNIDTSFLDF